MAKTAEERAAEDMLGEDLNALKAESEERLHPILSNEQVLAARAKAKKTVEADRVKAAMAAIEKEETQRLRVEEGLTTGIDAMDELVDITIDLPPYAGTCININGPMGMHYYHGKTYPAVPRHVAQSLNEMMFRMWRHEDQTEGRDIRQMYARKRDTSISARTGAVANAPARFDA